MDKSIIDLMNEVVDKFNSYEDVNKVTKQTSVVSIETGEPVINNDTTGQFDKFSNLIDPKRFKIEHNDIKPKNDLVRLITGLDETTRTKLLSAELETITAFNAVVEALGSSATSVKSTHQKQIQSINAKIAKVAADLNVVPDSEPEKKAKYEAKDQNLRRERAQIYITNGVEPRSTYKDMNIYLALKEVQK
jgi:hypothetical protein